MRIWKTHANTHDVRGWTRARLVNMRGDTGLITRKLSQVWAYLVASEPGELDTAVPVMYIRAEVHKDENRRLNFFCGR